MSSQSYVLEHRYNQKLSKQGRIIVSNKGWILRIGTLVLIWTIILFTIQTGLILDEPLVILSIILPIHSFLLLAIGWFFYKNPATGKADNSFVSVIIPVYNQESMIAKVIDAINRSTHRNFEIIAVNDGSKDNTKQVLDELTEQYSKLRVIHKKNEGKRRAVASGFYASKGRYIVLVDSDSIVDPNALTEFVKTFNGNPKAGALVGHAKVWNSEKNFLTHLQEVWYDYFFNIRKTTESIFGSVLCCSGCMAAYRKEAIMGYIPYWLNLPMTGGDDRELTSYTIAPKSAKKDFANLFQPKLSALSRKTLIAMSNYDDAEDRALTAQSLLTWRSIYVASALVYTDVPETWKIFFRQQKRWKKGTTRVNFFVSTFFWRKNPIMALIFYLDFMSIFSTPLIIVTIFVYVPIIFGDLLIPLVYFGGMVIPGLAQGLDYKFRNLGAKNWKIKPIMDLITSFITSWLIFPSIWGFRKNEWLTR